MHQTGVDASYQRNTINSDDEINEQHEVDPYDEGVGD